MLRLCNEKRSLDHFIIYLEEIVRAQRAAPITKVFQLEQLREICAEHKMKINTDYTGIVIETNHSQGVKNLKTSKCRHGGDIQ